MKDDTNRQSTEFSTPLILSKKEGWRIRAKLAVRPGEPPKIGLFRPGTHDVVDMRGCKDHHSSIEKALELIRTKDFIPYSEETLQGDLRYLQLTVERKTGLVQLVLVANGDGKCRELAHELAASPIFHSVWINVQTGSTNTIFGSIWHRVSGEEVIEQELLGKTVHFHPACFIQANFDLFEKTVFDMKRMLLKGKRVLELYAGVGAIGRVMAEVSASVDLVEQNPFAEHCFQLGAVEENVRFHTGESGDFAELVSEAEVLIVDPPRKGLDNATLEAITRSDLEQILYLSCNEASLERDLRMLQEAGWSVSEVRRYEFFPGTNHVETLMCCTR